MMLLYTDGTGRVTLTHYQPDLLTRSQRQAATLEVEQLPEQPEASDGTSAVLRVHDGEPVWSVEPPPPTRHQRDQAVHVTADLVAQMVVAGTLDTDTLTQVQAAFQPWEPWQPVEVGDVRLWADSLVECIQAHTTQADWTPDAATTLWKVHRTTTGTEPDEWVQPEGSHDAYNIGDRVTFEGKVYESTIDGNVWSPTDYPQGWSEVVA